MIRIGIVDDEKQERDQLKQALARFSAENGTELNVQEFDCAAVYLAICRRCPAWNWPKKFGRQIKTSSSFFARICSNSR